MNRKLNEKFMIEISKIKNPVFFIAITHMLSVDTMEKDKKTPRNFVDMFSDVMAKYDMLPDKRKKEIWKVLKNANRTKDSETNLESVQDLPDVRPQSESD